MEKKKNVSIDGHSIELSHLNKIFYPKANLTKNDIVDYYHKISPYFIDYVKNHIIVMHRFPDGIKKSGFYQKAVPDYFPSWIKIKTVELKKGEKQTLVVIQDAASLVYLANQGVLVFHSWLSSIDSVNNPSKIVFDFDPSNGEIKDLHFAAKKVKKIIEDRGLVPYVMTTGSRGYHVVVPIKANHTFKEVHEFAKNIAHKLAEQYPDKLTDEIEKSKRKGRIFIDYLRNSFGQTSVAPYSLRAKEGAPVATPIDWDELSTTGPQKYSIKNIFKRLGHKDDPWKNFERNARTLDLE